MTVFIFYSFTFQHFLYYFQAIKSKKPLGHGWLAWGFATELPSPEFINNGFEMDVAGLQLDEVFY